MNRVTQPDYLDGELIRVNANDAVVTVHLREEETIHKCTTDAQTASKLTPFLNGPPIRVFGRATWLRHGDTGWELQEFVIENFVLLENKTLAEALSEFEKLPSPDWRRPTLDDFHIDWKE